MADGVENNNNSAPEMSNGASRTSTIFAKPFSDVSKIDVFSSQNFRLWHERVSTLLHMYEVASTLTTSKPDPSSPAKQIEDWIHANKVCHHTMLIALSNDLFDVYCSYKEAKEIWDSLNTRQRCRLTKIRYRKLLPLGDDRG